MSHEDAALAAAVDDVFDELAMVPALRELCATCGHPMGQHAAPDSGAGGTPCMALVQGDGGPVECACSRFLPIP